MLLKLDLFIQSRRSDCHFWVVILSTKFEESLGVSGTPLCDSLRTFTDHNVLLCDCEIHQSEAAALLLNTFIPLQKRNESGTLFPFILLLEFWPLRLILQRVQSDFHGGCPRKTDHVNRVILTSLCAWSKFWLSNDKRMCNQSNAVLHLGISPKFLTQFLFYCSGFSCFENA